MRIYTQNNEEPKLLYISQIGKFSSEFEEDMNNAVV
jgi:hypothetical protein